MDDELQEALADVVAAAENAEQRQAILAWCEAFRTDPHPECVLPYFVECVNAQAFFDPALCDLADTGRILLSTLDE